MERTGSLLVRVVTSRAQLPVAGAAVVITTPDRTGKAAILAVLETDESGLAGPMLLPAPTTPTDGTTPGGPTPYAMYSLLVEYPGYEAAVVDGFQVFPNVQSVQTINLIPLAGRVPERASGAASQTL